MAPVRTLTVALSLAALAAPAFAQNTQFELDNLRAQQEAATRRAVAQDNELTALEGRLRTQQAVADLQAMRNPPRAPELAYAPAAYVPGPAATAKYPAIPDAALAESNRRVQAASQQPKR